MHTAAPYETDQASRLIVQLGIQSVFFSPYLTTVVSWLFMTDHMCYLSEYNEQGQCFKELWLGAITYMLTCNCMEQSPTCLHVSVWSNPRLEEIPQGLIGFINTGSLMGFIQLGL
jgi:hypothetical protein